DEVLLAKHHLRVPADGFERGRLLVLADDAEDDAAPREVLHRALEVDERLAQPVVPAKAQVLPSHVADDATPQRVVEVEYQELSRAAGETDHRGLDVARGLGEHV